MFSLGLTHSLSFSLRDEQGGEGRKKGLAPSTKKKSLLAVFCAFDMRGCVRACVQHQQGFGTANLFRQSCERKFVQVALSYPKNTARTAGINRREHRAGIAQEYPYRALLPVRKPSYTHWSVSQQSRTARHWSGGSGKSGKGAWPERGNPSLACWVS